MLEKIKNFVCKNYLLILLVLVLLAGIFFRVYQFRDGLFFKMDQARDAFTAQKAFDQGPGQLPLLGPKAGGTNVKLGPVFYYFQYVATVLFQSVEPQVLAFPDLFFSILSIPLLYLFLRKYFSQVWGLVLTAAYSLNFLAIEYSRFAWNPNALPFFNLLYFISVLNIFDDKIKYRLRWFILAGLSFAVSTQLHFLSFFTLPLITLIFISVNREAFHKQFDWKKIVLFFFIVLVAYCPVIVHEIYPHGSDAKEFIKAVLSKPDNHTFFQKIVRDIRYYGQNWFTILTSFVGKKADILGSTLVWLGLILPGIMLNYRNFRTEQDKVRKNFLLITLIWFPIYFVAYIPIAYDIRPRFFLPMIVLPFIYLGYIWKYLDESKIKFVRMSAMLLPILVIVLNLYGTMDWFREMKEAQQKAVYPERTIILKAKDGITLWHLDRSVDYMINDCGTNIVYFKSSAEYHRPIKYLLGLRGVVGSALTEMEDGNPDACIYYLKTTRSKNKSFDKDELDIVDEAVFGAWTVLSLRVNDEYSGQKLSSYQKGSQTSSEGEDTGRLYWKDIFD